MSSFLLDTHTLLWYLSGDAKLPNTILQLIENPNHQLSISIASYWEIAIKLSIGKLRIPVSLSELISRAKALEIKTLAPDEATILRVETLPFHHKDPFDRLIAAQANQGKLCLLSKDQVFDLYEVERTW